MKIILASGSPRRKELLARLGVDFSVIVSPAEEIDDVSLGIIGLCTENARLKCAAVACDFPECIVIGADTLVFLDGIPFGKPKSLEEAAGMLRSLSGREHQVCTGVYIAGPGSQSITLYDISNVTFHQLDEATIAEYHSKMNPLDKAGAYGIQNYQEMIVQQIDGSVENVMGFPIHLIRDALISISPNQVR